MAAIGPSASATDRARLCFRATIVGIGLYVILDVAAQSLPPHYSPMSQAESDLAVGPYGYVMAVNFVNRGLFSLVFLLGLMEGLPSKSGFRSGYILLGVWAIGALILAVAPTDVGTPATFHGVVHILVATLAFFGAAFGTLSLSRAFGRDPALKNVARYGIPLSILVLAALLSLYGGPLVLPHVAARVGGLVERAFIGLVLVWMLAVSALMLRRVGPIVGTRGDGAP